MMPPRNSRFGSRKGWNPPIKATLLHSSRTRPLSNRDRRGHHFPRDSQELDKPRITKLPLALVTVSALAVAACQPVTLNNPDPNANTRRGALVGAGLGFLWYNSYPAELFMGDVGSLALGGALGTVALLIKQELLLPVVGAVFAIELLSVVIQVGSFKLTGRRVFRMAPLHHHCELIGWSEPKVISRFLILAVVFACFSLATLKLR